MKIESVSVAYGELRSGSDFTNKRYEIALSAKLEVGENARSVKDKLFELAKREVKLFFGDDINQTEMDVPFNHSPKH